jgi:hypothetical protein
MITVYVKLLGEGTLVFRPVPAELVGGTTAKLLPVDDYASSGEEWEFPPESTVTCENRVLEGKEVWVAVAAKA